MTATAAKARYFLEQSVPELKEFERKKIFTAEEITSIAKRRSDFEYKINARGSTPGDYLRYAEFEINVEALRRRRVKRMRVKSTAHNGQRRIYFVFDRGTRKFPGDMDLWMQNIEYTRRQQANKKLTQTITSALRLHPNKPELWIYAASCAAEDRGDMSEARSYMQRALRFVKNSRALWIEYARLEVAYMAKIHARRQVLGIGTSAEANHPVEDDEDQNVIRLPKLTSEDVNPDNSEDQDIDTLALSNLENTPVMSGAIPRAIFDAAMTHFREEVALAIRFFEMIVGFGNVPAARSLRDHVLHQMREKSAKAWQTFACGTAATTLDISSSSHEYPSALRQSLRMIDEGLSNCADKAAFLSWARNWLTAQLKSGCDPAIEKVLRAKLATIGDMA